MTSTVLNAPDIEAQREFYDQRWQQHDYANRLRLQRTVGILDALVGTRRYQPRMVDLGCGAGWLTAVLGQFGPTLGIELSPKAVEEARIRYPSLQFEAHDLLTWDAPEAEFEVAISHEVIEHFEEPERHVELAARLLVDGGHFILTTPNPRTFNAMPDAQRDAWTDQPLENWIERRELHRLLERNGFEIERSTTLIPGYGSRGLYRWVNARRVAAIAHFFGLGPIFERRRLAAGFGLHYLIVARKRSQ